MNHNDNDTAADRGGGAYQNTNQNSSHNQHLDRGPNQQSLSSRSKLPDTERRTTGGEDMIMSVIKQVRDDVRSLDRKITDHRKDVQGAINESISELVTAAFPKKDLSRHFNSHADSEEAEENRKQLYRHVREKTVGGIVWAALALCALAVWELVKAKLLAS